MSGMGHFDGRLIEEKSIPLNRLEAMPVTSQEFYNHENNANNPHGPILYQDKVTINNNATLTANAPGELNIRNDNDTHYAVINCAGINIYEGGQINQITVNELNLQDNFITLNADNTGPALSNSGIKIKRHGYDSVSIYWDEVLSDFYVLSALGANNIGPYILAHGGNTYNKTQSDDRFVNVTGDYMSDALRIQPHVNRTALILQSQGHDDNVILRFDNGPRQSLINADSGVLIITPYEKTQIYKPVEFYSSAGNSRMTLSMINAANPSFETNMPGFDFNKIINAPGFNASGSKIINLANPTADTDAVNLGFADNRYVNVTGDYMTEMLHIQPHSDNTALLLESTPPSSSVLLGFKNNAKRSNIEANDGVFKFTPYTKTQIYKPVEFYSSTGSSSVILTVTDSDNANINTNRAGFDFNKIINAPGFNASGSKIINLANPTANTDAVNLGFADNRYVNVTGDAMSDALSIKPNANNYAIILQSKADTGSVILRFDNGAKQSYIEAANGVLKIKGSTKTQIYSVLDILSATGNNSASVTITDSANVAINTTRAGFDFNKILKAPGFDASSNKIINLANPTANTDAVNLGFADGRYVNVTGDAMSDALSIKPNANNYALILQSKVTTGSVILRFDNGNNASLIEAANGVLKLTPYTKTQIYKPVEFYSSTGSNSVILTITDSANAAINTTRAGFDFNKTVKAPGFDAGGSKITNLANPTAATDAVNLGFADGRYIYATGDAMSDALTIKPNTGNNALILQSKADAGSVILRFDNGAKQSYIEAANGVLKIKGSTKTQIYSVLDILSATGNSNASITVTDSANVAISTTRAGFDFNKILKAPGFDASSNKITNLANPTANTDAVNLGFADGRYVNIAGGDTMTSTLTIKPSTGNNALTLQSRLDAGSVILRFDNGAKQSYIEAANGVLKIKGSEKTQIYSVLDILSATGNNSASITVTDSANVAISTTRSGFDFSKIVKAPGFDANSNKIINVANPSANSDAMNLGFADENYVKVSGSGTNPMTGALIVKPSRGNNAMLLHSRIDTGSVLLQFINGDKISYIEAANGVLKISGNTKTQIYAPLEIVTNGVVSQVVTEADLSNTTNTQTIRSTIGGIIKWYSGAFKGDDSYEQIAISGFSGTNYAVAITPVGNTSAKVGEYYVTKSSGYFRVYNSGSGTSNFNAIVVGAAA